MVVPNSNAIETKLFKLMADKQKLESQINAFGDILAQNGNVGMTGALIDADGFPRNDIDVYQVRQARQQIICMQNDHKELMKEIEQLMHQLHAGAKNDQQQQLSHKAAGMDLNSSSSSDDYDHYELIPILKVSNLLPESPAEEAGLRNDDDISVFGSANAKNFDGRIQIIANIVRNMRDKRIPLKVIRNGELLDLVLIPHDWSGEGLLGCTVIVADDI